MCCALVTNEYFSNRNSTGHPTVHSQQYSTPNNYLVPNLSPVPSHNARGGFSVLPPIREQPKQELSPGGVSDMETMVLSNEIMRTLKSVPIVELQEMIRSMRSLDMDKDGILTADQVKSVLNRYIMYLNERCEMGLINKFGHIGYGGRSMVNYENLGSYLLKVRKDANNMPNEVNVPAFAGLSDPTPHRSTRGHTPYGNFYKKANFNDRDEAKLIIDLERQLSHQSPNMADLRRIMYGMDRGRRDVLSSKQIQEAFERCDLHLSPDLFTRLLFATDRMNTGLYRIEQLMDYLTKVIPEAHNVMTGRAFTEEVPMNAPWEYVHPTQRPDTKASYIDEGFSEYELSPSPHPSQYGTAITPDLSRQMLSPAPSMGIKSRTPSPEPEEPFQMDRWKTQYQFMMQALYNADDKNLGFLPAQEVRHIADNYNLVYNLKISLASLEHALEISYDSEIAAVNIERFIATLQNRHVLEKT